MKFGNIHLYLVACFFVLFVSTKAQVFMAGQCNSQFKIGFRTENSSRSPQKITYHGKKFKLHQCIGINERNKAVQCSFKYKTGYRYYTFEFVKHIKGATRVDGHKCVISRVIKSVDEPHEVSTAEMSNNVIVESKYDVGNGRWKWSYDKYKVTEYQYINYNNS